MIIVTCRDLTELATERKEGSLTLMQRTAVGAHLAWCTRCRTYLEQMDLTVSALAGLPHEPVEEDVHAALMAQFEARAPKRST